MNDIERKRSENQHRRKLATATFEAPTHDCGLFEVSWEGKVFKVAAEQGAVIDLATPDSGTYPLDVDEAEALAAALLSAAREIRER